MNYTTKSLSFAACALINFLLVTGSIVAQIDTSQPLKHKVALAGQANSLLKSEAVTADRQVQTIAAPEIYTHSIGVETADSNTEASLGLRIRPNESVENDPTLMHEVFEDFINGTGHTLLEKINQLASAGGGSGQGWLAGPVYEDAWGVIEAHHGTGPYSRLDLVGKTNNMYGVAVGLGTAYEYQVRFNFANLSTETNRYIAFDGFFDGDTVDPTFYRGILFRYSDNINDGRFQVVVRASEGVETLIDTGIEPAPNTWYRLKVSVNATGTEALFFINGSQVAAVTTNLAIGPGKRYTAESNTDRQSGNTDFVSRRFDYVRFKAVSGRRSRL